VPLLDIAYSPLHEKIDAAALAQLETYAGLLHTEAMPGGFIGDCTIEELYLRHILDSVLPAIAPESSADFPLNNTSGLKVFDLGAGAGLPSLPLAILFPQHEFHLLDSQEKRCRFAESAAAAVGLKNVHVYHGVVQDFAQKYGKDKKADVVVFRAFRKILASLELALHVLRDAPPPNGGEMHRAQPKVLYWRSQRVPFSDEGNTRVSDMGYQIDSFVKFTSAEAILPRGLYTFSRVRTQKAAYPRSWKKISADRLVEVES